MFENFLDAREFLEPPAVDTISSLSLIWNNFTLDVLSLEFCVFGVVMTITSLSLPPQSRPFPSAAGVDTCRGLSQVQFRSPSAVPVGFEFAILPEIWDVCLRFILAADPLFPAFEPLRFLTLNWAGFNLLLAVASSVTILDIFGFLAALAFNWVYLGNLLDVRLFSESLDPKIFFVFSIYNIIFWFQLQMPNLELINWNLIINRVYTKLEFGRMCKSCITYILR